MFFNPNFQRNKTFTYLIEILNQSYRGTDMVDKLDCICRKNTEYKACINWFDVIKSWFTNQFSNFVWLLIKPHPHFPDEEHLKYSIPD